MEINKEYILELSRGLFQLQESEKRKLEFKRQWYDLSGNNPRDTEEFCKDMTAMANTPGPDGFIVIGLDETNGQLTNSPISVSGLSDTQITNLIIKRIRPSIQFEIDTIAIPEDQNKVITVIKIPPSLEKPHVMGEYLKFDGSSIKNRIQNFIPIRNGTQIFPANHADLEYMFYDRKNVIPDYRLEFLQIQNAVAFNVVNAGGYNCLTCGIRFIVQNIGRYPVAISSAELKLFDTKPRVSTMKDEFYFTGYSWIVFEKNFVGHIDYPFKAKPIVIPYNSMHEISITFWSIDETSKLDPINFDVRVRALRDVQHYKYSMLLKSANDRAFPSGILEV